MPQRKPSPPDRAAIGGTSVNVNVDDEDSVEELLAPQQMTLCFPLASMAQKNPFSPNAAEIVPMDPNPYTVTGRKISKLVRNKYKIRMALSFMDT